MSTNNVTVEVAEDDVMTTRLARVLLCCEIAGQVLACYMVLEMIEHGQISKKIAWYLDRYKQRIESRRLAEQQWRQSVGRMFFEAQRTLTEA